MSNFTDILNFRVGTGYDVHRLEEGKDLVLCGVHIPFEKGPVAHSDGDALLHAVCDALLGACALGDIGKHFPPSDDRWKGAPGLDLLERTANIIRENGFDIINIDSVIILERPKVAPFIMQMRENAAKAANIELDRFSIKATTEEKLGFTGSGEGIAASAVAAVIKL